MHFGDHNYGWVLFDGILGISQSTKLPNGAVASRSLSDHYHLDTLYIPTDTAHVVVSVRYWDHLAHEQVRLLGDMAKDWTWVQGFVDNKGKFVTREEALVIAEEAGQRFWDELRYEQLFSENLY